MHSSTRVAIIDKFTENYIVMTGACFKEERYRGSKISEGNVCMLKTIGWATPNSGDEKNKKKKRIIIYIY